MAPALVPTSRPAYVLQFQDVEILPLPSSGSFRMTVLGKMREREALRFRGIAHRSGRGINRSAKIPVARNCLANEGLFVLKPDSGSARQRWARENSKHRRTATRQRGFRSSLPKQFPLDFCQVRVTPENGPFKIIAEAAFPRAPAESTELPKFRGRGEFCQCRGLEPAIGVERRDVDVARRKDQKRALGDVGQRVNLIAATDAQSAPAEQEERDIGAQGR